MDWATQAIGMTACSGGEAKKKRRLGAEEVSHQILDKRRKMEGLLDRQKVGMLTIKPGYSSATTRRGISIYSMYIGIAYTVLLCIV
ncbi:hypothetical protein [Paenibacillus periandrae]|uniref:hypothetical protein n=1 Tax=Paenibacillus periandrae TaxID=1761741 RepID=UPI001F08E732|nr:hypothetical protein [Paenibacillus periandrae]